MPSRTGCCYTGEAHRCAVRFVPLSSTGSPHSLSGAQDHAQHGRMCSPTCRFRRHLFLYASFCIIFYFLCPPKKARSLAQCPFRFCKCQQMRGALMELARIRSIPVAPVGSRPRIHYVLRDRYPRQPAVLPRGVFQRAGDPTVRPTVPVLSRSRVGAASRENGCCPRESYLVSRCNANNSSIARLYLVAYCPPLPGVRPVSTLVDNSDRRRHTTGRYWLAGRHILVCGDSGSR